MSKNRRKKTSSGKSTAASQNAPPRPRTRLMLVLPQAPSEAVINSLPEALAAGDVASVLVWAETIDPKALSVLAERILPAVAAVDAAALLRGDAQLVARLGFDGFHADGTIADLTDACERLQPDRIVGAGNVRSRHEAMEAGEAGADYVFFGHPGPGETKGNAAELLLDRVMWWQPLFEIPCVALATSLDQVGMLASAGADFVALGEAALEDPRGLVAVVSEAERALVEAHGARK